MKSLFTSLVILVCSGIVFANSAPTVSNVTASQRTDGSGIVDIYYTLSDADGDKCAVSVQVSNDGGNNYNIIPTSLSPDLTNVSPGRRYITWNSKTDLPGEFGTNFQVKVTAYDIHLDEGLVAYYKLDGTSGAVIDEMGNNSGINYGAARGVSGKVGNAFSFDGDYVEIPYSPILQIDTDSTITMWVYITNRNNYQTFISQRKTAAGHATMWLDIESGRLRHIDDGNSRVINYHSTDFPENQWVFISLRKIRTLHKNYLGINGVEEEFTSSTGSLVDDDNPIFLGKGFWDSYYLAGKIDEVRIYNRALSSAEISELYNNAN